MSSDILFTSYFPVYRAQDDFYWLKADYGMLFQTIFPGKDIWDAPYDYSAANALYEFARSLGLFTVKDRKKFMDAYLRSLLKEFQSHYHCYGPKDSSAVEISHGQYHEADENMGVSYYKVGCRMPRSLLYEIIYHQSAFLRFLGQRVKKRRVYRFLKPKEKWDLSWWRDPFKWQGFDMGLVLDFHLHSLPYSARIFRRTNNWQWAVRNNLIHDEESSPSEYLDVPDWFRKAYKHIIETPGLFDHVDYQDRTRKVYELAQAYRPDV